MSTTLERRLAKIESRGTDALRIWETIVLAGEHPTPEEQEALDAIEARGHNVVIYSIIESKVLPAEERHEA